MTTTTVDLTANVCTMNPEQLQGLFQNLTLRKGLRFDIELAFLTGEPLTRFTIDVENSYRPGVQSKLFMLKRIPGFVHTVEDFYDWHLAMALWFDRHEGREWFKVNGVPWLDPHADNGWADHFHPQAMFAEVKAMRVKPDIFGPLTCPDCV